MASKAQKPEFTTIYLVRSFYDVSAPQIVAVEAKITAKVVAVEASVDTLGRSRLPLNEVYRTPVDAAGAHHARALELEARAVRQLSVARHRLAAAEALLRNARSDARQAQQ